MIHPRTVILTLVAAAALAVAATPGPVTAQPAGPSPADIESAKKAFGEGKALFDAKKYGEAIDKFKESYRLSKNPLLLYNIAVSLGANNQEDMALFYYKKFLTDAPADAAQRPDAETAAKTLEAKLGPNAGKSETAPTGDGGKVPGPTGDGGKTEPPVKAPPKIKPAGTYTAADFKHRIVEEAPPGERLDLTAVVPPDSGFTVTLYYRGAGEAQFTPAPMKWRYNELVGRVPAKRMSGTSVQYYLEVKDPAGGVVTKVAKPASPNVVYLETSASSQFYSDWSPDTASTTHDGGVAPTPVNTGTSTGTRPVEDDPLHADTSDDPLAAGKGRGNGKNGNGNGGRRVTDSTTFPDDGSGAGGGDMGGGGGFMDVGSSKFTIAKWGATAVGGALLATSVIFYFRATNSASTIESEANVTGCQDGSLPPCEFDDFLRDAESTGKSSETLSKITFGIGIAVAGVAGYLWIKDLKTPARERRASKKSRPKFLAVPAIGDGSIGGAAAWEW